MVDREEQKNQNGSKEDLVAGMTAAQRHELMLKVRLTLEQNKEFEAGLQGMVDNLNRNVLEENKLP